MRNDLIVDKCYESHIAYSCNFPNMGQVDVLNIFDILLNIPDGSSEGSSKIECSPTDMDDSDLNNSDDSCQAEFPPTDIFDLNKTDDTSNESNEENMLDAEGNCQKINNYQIL